MVPQLFTMTLCLHQTPDLWSVIDLYLMVGIGGYGRVNPGVQGPLRITEPLAFLCPVSAAWCMVLLGTERQLTHWCVFPTHFGISYLILTTS